MATIQKQLRGTEHERRVARIIARSMDRKLEGHSQVSVRGPTVKLPISSPILEAEIRCFKPKPGTPLPSTIVYSWLSGKDIPLGDSIQHAAAAVLEFLTTVQIPPHISCTVNRFSASDASDGRVHAIHIDVFESK